MIIINYEEITRRIKDEPEMFPILTGLSYNDAIEIEKKYLDKIEIKYDEITDEETSLFCCASAYLNFEDGKVIRLSPKLTQFLLQQKVDKNYKTESQMPFKEFILLTNLPFSIGRVKTIHVTFSCEGYREIPLRDYPTIMDSIAYYGMYPIATLLKKDGTMETMWCDKYRYDKSTIEEKILYELVVAFVRMMQMSKNIVIEKLKHSYGSVAVTKGKLREFINKIPKVLRNVICVGVHWRGLRSDFFKNKKGEVIEVMSYYRKGNNKIKGLKKRGETVWFNESRIREMAEKVMNKVSVKTRMLAGLELDIYFPQDKIAIEYNGIQHYEYPNPFHKTEEQYFAQVKRDIRKEELCKQNGIKLIVIPYWKETTVETLKKLILS